MNIEKMIDTIFWKKEQIKEAKILGIRTNIFQHINKEYRKEFFEKLNSKKLNRIKDVIKTLRIKLPLYYDISILYEIFVKKIYEKFGFVPSFSDVVFDIGAYKGDTILYYALLHKATVVAFEPVFENYIICRDVIKLNNLNNVKIYNIAIGEDIHGKIQGNMLMSGNKKYKSISIDHFVKRNNIIPSILKIDVEKFEYNVLNSGKYTIDLYRPKIIVETHTATLYKKVLKFMEEHNYTLIYNDNGIINLSNGMNKVNNLFFMGE